MRDAGGHEEDAAARGGEALRMVHDELKGEGEAKVKPRSNLHMRCTVTAGREHKLRQRPRRARASSGSRVFLHES